MLRRRAMFRSWTRPVAAAALVAACAADLRAATGFADDMNRATFDAAARGWIVQSYAKGQGTFGRVPGAVLGDTAYRYAVRADAAGVVTQTNTATSATFVPPTAAGQYLEFSTTILLNWSSAKTPGLVFGISAYGRDAAGDEYATNFELVTSQLNTVNTSGVAFDRLLLSSYNDYGDATPNNKWFAYFESGVNATDAFHRYDMRIYRDKVEYVVDGDVIATTTEDVPAGTGLHFVLNAWAPDTSWGTAYAAMPADSYSYMDVDSVSVAYRTVPEPGVAAVASAALGLAARSRRRSV